jgi:transcription elongation factor GreB
VSRPRYITPQGFKVLADEHTTIWTVLRPRIVADVEAAAALGDRSDNADYRYGKRKLRELDGRLRFLSERMDALTVLEPSPHPSGRAYFGAWVTVEREDGEVARYRLVGPDEFDVARGLLSVDSPLGRALLGKAAGDGALVQRPDGVQEITVLEVSWTAPGDGEPAATPRPASRPKAVSPPRPKATPARPAKPRPARRRPRP